jgi:thiamine pyrophosphokinase
VAVLIFANGNIADPAWIKPALANATAIIAADGGSRHLYALDFRPNLVIGDLDSTPPQVLQWLAAGAVPTLQHPAAKDETDFELALLYAARHFSEPIRIYGALGGRLDQELANIFLLAHPALDSRDVRLVEAQQQAWLVSDATTVTGNIGDTVSLIPLAGDVRVARTTGLEWELEDDVLEFGPARGISNRLSAETATITLQSGIILCVHSRREWQR